MKGKEELAEIRKLDGSELQTRLGESERELMNLRFRQSSGQLTQSAQLKLVRRRIARIKTILNETRAAEGNTAQGA